jgi:hypothetical protein
MPILLNQIRLLAFIAFFCVGWLDPTVGGPAEALSGVKKTVLVLRGDRLSIPAVKTLGASFDGWPVRVGSQKTCKFSWNTSISLVSPVAQYGEDLVRYLRSRYAARKPDVVFAFGSSCAGSRVCTPRRAVSGRANCLYECGTSSCREERNATGCHLTLDGLNV